MILSRSKFPRQRPRLQRKILLPSAAKIGIGGVLTPLSLPHHRTFGASADATLVVFELADFLRQPFPTSQVSYLHFRNPSPPSDFHLQAVTILGTPKKRGGR